MGFLDKVKNLFTEEIEVEEVPIKKEVMKVEIPAPAVEEVKPTSKPILVENIEERESIKREEKVRTPVFFDDKDFISLEKPKPVEKPKVMELPKKEAYGIKKEEPKKKFAPSPIISPVYGVLDKNYHKEDIATKGEKRITTKYPSRISSTRTLSIDDVMKKAYGTLEDELETTMQEANLELPKEEAEVVEPTIESVTQKDIYSEFNLLDDIPISTKEMEDVPSIERQNEIDPLSGLELDVKEDDLLNDNFGDESLKETSEVEEENMIAEAMDKMSDNGDNNDESIDLKESDLFNLIDSMYEKRDEE